MKMTDRAKMFARRLLSYIYHRLGKKQTVIALEANPDTESDIKLILDYDFISQILEGTVNGKYNWECIYKRFIHDSTEMTICFKVEEEVLSGDSRVLIIASVQNKDAVLAYFYQEDKEWIIINQLKYAIIKSIGD